nr:carbon-nitrogen hydrolase family protein [uncultured Cohaesibacter sp.]
MTSNYKIIKAAAIQAASVFLDLDGSITKAIGLIEEAAVNGAQIIAFPEVWAPGYPWWIRLDGPALGMKFMKRYHENALSHDSDQFARLRKAARDNSIMVVFGYVEKSGGSLYMGQSIIDASGEVLQHRRKLKPSGVERTVFGEGDGSHLAVQDTDLGRVGALCCWEHLQPLSKYAMYAQREEIHVAAWPALSMGRGLRYAVSPEMTNSINSVYALEGGTFVIAPTAVNDQVIVDMLCDTPEKLKIMGLTDGAPAGGNAAIFGPDGSIISESLPEDQEGIVYADLDLSKVALSKFHNDIVGHAARPDVLQLHHDKRSKPAFDTMRCEPQIVMNAFSETEEESANSINSGSLIQSISQ